MENQLIRISQKLINNILTDTVNARDLHEFLEVGKDFSNWIKARIEQYSFQQEIDFTVFFSTRQNGRAGNRGNKLEYAISLDMAKELAMVERNEKGKQARQYFIDCERKAKSAQGDVHSVLSNPSKLRDILISYTHKVEQLESTIKEQEPKVIFHDRVGSSVNAQTIQQVAKVLGTGQARLFAWLRQQGILMANNLPYQQHVDAGRLRVIEKPYTDRHGESRIYTQTLVTGKGLSYIQRKIDRAGVEQ